MERISFFSGRLGRKHYFVAWITFVLVIALFLFKYKQQFENPREITKLAEIVVIFSLIIFDAKRLRDINLPGKIALIPALIGIFIPFLALIWECFLFFKKGTPGENKYGRPTNNLPFLKAIKNNSYGNKKRFVSVKDWETKDYAKNAITGLLGGYIGSISGYLIGEVIGDVLALAGVVCGIIFIYKKLKERKSGKIEEKTPVPTVLVSSHQDEKRKFKNPLAKLYAHKLLIIILCVLSLIVYWYEIRPMQIKKQCSWFTETIPGEPATPAFAGITKEEVDRRNAQIKIDNDCENARAELDRLLCSSTFTEQPPRPAKPAGPSREIIREATKAEYDSCIRHHGL